MTENLHPHEDPKRRCLKVHEWPEADRLAWERALEPGDILDDTVGPGAHWSKQTREKYRKGYGRWLTFLTLNGEIDPDQCLADRVTQDRIQAYLTELDTMVSSWTAWGRIAELLAAVKAMAPDHDWSWLRRVVSRLERRVRSSKNKLQRLRPAHEIAAWAYARLDDLIARDIERRRTHIHYRDALMVALLIHCPVRLANLTMIRIDQHLRRLTNGYQLVFKPAETKTRKPLTVPVPDELTCYLDHYLEVVRPIFPRAQETDRLWITYQGRPMPQKNAFERISRTTERAFGKPINPHLFRDCAVTTVAIEDPEHIGIAAPILGHTDPRTTEEHYIQAHMIAASRRLGQSIDTLKKELRPPRRRRPRPRMTETSSSGNEPIESRENGNAG